MLTNTGFTSVLFVWDWVFLGGGGELVQEPPQLAIGEGKEMWLNLHPSPPSMV